MNKIVGLLLLILLTNTLLAQKDSVVTRKDRKRDVLLQTNYGDITIRLSDSTPLHRDNFLKLTKTHFYDSVLFHRVIKNFMIQGGDPDSKNAAAGKPLGNGGPAYRIPAATARPCGFGRRGLFLPGCTSASRCARGTGRPTRRTRGAAGAWSCG